MEKTPEINRYDFDGVLRPKTFFEMHYLKQTTYVRAIPFLLRVRLWLAMKRCERMARKVDKFCANNGFNYGCPPKDAPVA